MATTVLNADRIQMTVEGLLPVIVAKSGDITMRIVLDKRHSLQLATAINAQARRINRMTSIQRGKR